MGSISSRTLKRDRALATFLRGHHSAIGIAELRRLGANSDAITGLIERGVLIRVHRGVYRSGHVAPNRHTMLRCGLFAGGPGAALARATAAHHLGFIDFAPAVPEIVVPRRSVGRARQDLLIHETAELPERDIRVVDGLRGTNAERTILDLATGTRTSPQFKLLRRAVRQATVKHRHLPERWSAIVEERKPFRGSRILSLILDEHLAGPPLLRSELEEAFLDLCRDAGLPLPEMNAIVEGHEVDAVWWEARVVAELDTYDFHGDVRAFERDRARDADLTVAGYRPIRITGRRLSKEPGKIIDQARALLGL